MSRSVTTRVWERVVYVVSPGTGRHRSHARIEELQRELQQEKAANDALRGELQLILNPGKQVEPQLSLPAPTAVAAPVGPPPSTDPEGRPEEQTESEFTVREIKVRPLSDIARLGAVPRQRTSSE